MTTQIKNRRGFWQGLLRRDGRGPSGHEAPADDAQQPSAAPEIDIAPNDPILAYLAGTPDVVEVDKLDLDSPALRAIKAADVKLVVPLVSQGELIGLLNLGPRLSQQEYSADDRKLLNDLAAQTAPAVRVAQLVRQQQLEAQERERIEHELKVARLIQQTLFPKETPKLPGYELCLLPACARGGRGLLGLPRTMPLGFHRAENIQWQHTLRRIAAHFGAAGEVETQVVCVDPKRRWRYYGNVRHNALVLSVFRAAAGPLRRARIGRAGAREQTARDAANVSRTGTSSGSNPQS